jgi:hypothetical protein
LWRQRRFRGRAQAAQGHLRKEQRGLLIRFGPDSTHFAAEIIDFIPERRTEFLNCLKRFNVTPAFEFLRTLWFVIHVMVGCEPWMCKCLCDVNTSGGIEAEHFLKEVNGCVGSSMFRTGRGNK